MTDDSPTPSPPSRRRRRSRRSRRRLRKRAIKRALIVIASVAAAGLVITGLWNMATTPRTLKQQTVTVSGVAAIVGPDGLQSQLTAWTEDGLLTAMVPVRSDPPQPGDTVCLALQRIRLPRSDTWVMADSGNCR